MHGCSGHLFGFSGMDGPTKEDIDFVGVFTPDAYSLRFCALKQEQQLTVTPPGDRASDVVVAATGDTLLVNTTNGALRMAWASDSILAGRAPSGTQLSLKDASSWSNTTGGASARPSMPGERVTLGLHCACSRMAREACGGLFLGQAPQKLRHLRPQRLCVRRRPILGATLTWRQW